MALRRTTAPLLRLTARSARSTIHRLTGRRGRVIIKMVRALAHDAATDETLKRSQLTVILRADKADRVAHRIGPAGAPDAMDVILRLHGEIVIHHV